MAVDGSRVVKDIFAEKKHRLIEEVRKRPSLWDLRKPASERHIDKIDALWDEVAEAVGVTGN